MEHGRIGCRSERQGERERMSGARPISRLIGSDESGMVIVFVFKQRRRVALSLSISSARVSKVKGWTDEGGRRASERARAEGCLYGHPPRRIDVLDLIKYECSALKLQNLRCVWLIFFSLRQNVQLVDEIFY